MKAHIYNQNNELLLSPTLTSDSQRTMKLMEEDSVTLCFVLKDPVAIPLGSWCMVEESDTTISHRQYLLQEEQPPQWNRQTGGWRYSVMFQEPLSLAKNKTMLFIPASGAVETSFSLTDTLQRHLDRIMSALVYQGVPWWSAFTVSDDVEGASEHRLVEYRNCTIWEALEKVCDVWQTEWYIDEATTTIRVGRCEQGEETDYALGTNLEDIKVSRSMGDYCTRLYVFGSEKNLTSRYRRRVVFLADHIYNDHLGRCCVVDRRRPDLLSWIDPNGWQETTSQRSKSSPSTDTQQTPISQDWTSGLELPIKDPGQDPMTPDVVVEFFANIGSAYTLDGTLLANVVQWDDNGKEFIFQDPAAALTQGERFVIEELPFRTALIPLEYFERTTGAVQSVNSLRLRLPAATHNNSYIDASEVDDFYTGYYNRQLVERVKVFDDVYPRTRQAVTAVSSYQKPVTLTNEEGTEEETGEMQTFYKIECANPFNANAIIKGKNLEITFTSGRLNGMTFEATFHRKTTEAEENFEIIANQTYGVTLPNTTLCPAIGDEFTLANWDCSYLSTMLVSRAEQELLTKGREYLLKCLNNINTYEVILRPTNAVIPPMGQRVRLVNTALCQQGERHTRVIGIQYELTRPYKCTITLGESDRYSRLKTLANRTKG